MYLLTTWYTSLLWDNGQIVSSTSLVSDPQTLAVRLADLSEARILPEERELAKEAGDRVRIMEERLEELGQLCAPPPDLDLLGLQAQMKVDPTLLHAAVLELGRQRARDSQTPDLQLLQAVTAYEELTETTNLVTDRVGQWVGLSLPELSARLRPLAVTKDLAQGMELPELAQAHELDLTQSLGVTAGEGAYAALQELAKLGVATAAAQEQMGQAIEKLMEELAPNLNQVVGPQLGARLINQAGGLERLARMPASALQLLGAETALFRHLRSGAKPPKHGLIYQHPLVHQSPPKIRGKAARLLAAKGALAAKLDFFKGEFLGPQLKEEVQAKVEKLRSAKK